MNEYYTWTIQKKVAEAPGVYSLYLAATEKRPDFIAGQYVTIVIPQHGPAEGKSYSISSAPHESLVRITIKEMGEFSRAILAHDVGDTITTSAPYGFFYPEPTESVPLTFIAGGIGITPIMSMLHDWMYRQERRAVALWYSAKTEADLIFAAELAEIETALPQFVRHTYLTQTPVAPAGFQAGRFTPEAIVAATPVMKEHDFFLCGSMDFTKALWTGLRATGIEAHQIYTEGFF